MEETCTSRQRSYCPHSEQTKPRDKAIRQHLWPPSDVSRHHVTLFLDLDRRRGSSFELRSFVCNLLGLVPVRDLNLHLRQHRSLTALCRSLSVRGRELCNALFLQSEKKRLPLQHRLIARNSALATTERVLHEANSKPHNPVLHASLCRIKAFCTPWDTNKHCRAAFRKQVPSTGKAIRP